MTNREEIRNLSEELLHDWCRSLRYLQINATENDRLDGGILCPACGMIHGRCIDAVYPFMRMAREARMAGEKREEEEWLRSADALLHWADQTVHSGNGVYLNDIDAGWTGTTVFFAISLADALWFHGDLLDGEMYEAWKQRLAQAAEFLYSFEGLIKNNINYPISNALAMYECWMVLGKEKYRKKAEQLAAIAQDYVTEQGLLMGEGVPWTKVSSRGCNPVDLGYNVEETLPSLALYGKLSGDTKAFETAERCLLAHLEFMLEDGGWDNSFGTRNYKWTYWGSRTSDGCALGYLLLADRHPECADASRRNLQLLKQCTCDGLLMGGPHYRQAGQAVCTHHSFCHAKVVAGILDRELTVTEEKWSVTDRKAAIKEKPSMKIYPELALWRVLTPSVTATVSAYDWEHTPGGHVSGGTLSMLHHKKLGTLFVAGMGDYWRKEPHNMQVSWKVKQECLAIRVEYMYNGTVYSSIYEEQARITVKDNRIEAEGELKNRAHECPENRSFRYRFCYEIKERGVDILAEFSVGHLICPVVSSSEECVDTDELDAGRLVFVKAAGRVVMTITGEAALPYGTERIFQLIPGFQAVRTDIEPIDGKAQVKLSW